MIPIDPEDWSVPISVGVGLIISQLFMYGKKVKSRVRITTSELVGDLMQFGVKMTITIATLHAIEFATDRALDGLWEVVAITIFICTSFDSYFVRVRELVLKRLFGAGAALFGTSGDEDEEARDKRIVYGVGGPTEQQKNMRVDKADENA